MNNPCFLFDLFRLTRKGWVTGLRWLYTTTLLIALWLVYQYNPVSSYNGLAGLGQAFVAAILGLQFVAVLLLTPAFVSGAIVEEKEKQTLDLLLTTQLSSAQIIYGKLFSRLAQVVAVLLAGLPILSLVLFFGGVEMGYILTGFVVTVMTLFSIASASIFCSLSSRSAWSALVSSYAIALLLGVLAIGMNGLFAASMRGTDLEAVVISNVLIHGLIALTFFTFVGNSDLRERQRELAPQQVTWTNPETGEVWRDEPLLRVPTKRLRQGLAGFAGRPGVSDRPMLWKELYVGADATKRFTLLFIVPWAGCASFALLLAFAVTQDNEALSNLTALTRIVGVLLAGCLCLVVGFRAAGTVVREKEQHTLDALLTLPIARREILATKWLGSLGRARWLALVLLVDVGLGVISGWNPFFAALFVISVCIHVAFVNSLGLWWSVLLPTRTRANVLFGLSLLLIPVAGYVTSVLLTEPQLEARDVWLQACRNSAFNPLSCWYYSAGGFEQILERWHEQYLREPRFRSPNWIQIADGLSAVGAGLMFSAFAAWFFWFAGWNCFAAKRSR